MSHVVTENRTAERNATRRIALVDLALDGLLVQTLAPGDYIKATVYAADGSVVVPTTNLTWQRVWVAADQTELWGWSMLLTTPDEAGTLTIRYEARVNNCYEFWSDTITVS